MCTPQRPTSPWLIHGLEPTACSFAATPITMPVRTRKAVWQDCEKELVVAEETIDEVVTKWPTMSKEQRAFLEPQMDRISRLVQRYTCLQMHLPPMRTPTNSPTKQLKTPTNSPTKQLKTPTHCPGSSPPTDWVTL